MYLFAKEDVICEILDDLRDHYESTTDNCLVFFGNLDVNGFRRDDCWRDEAVNFVVRLHL